MTTSHSIEQNSWLTTSSGDPRGYIDFQELKEIWFHTGTLCNLRCPDCFEHSGPEANRLDAVSLDDVAPYVDHAAALGARQFSFTGGEPFVNRQMVPILAHALDRSPCLVLSNGTGPFLSRFNEILHLNKKEHALSFRISLDYPDPDRHDALRGKGMFNLALMSLGKLQRARFHVSVARRRENGENTSEANAAYLPLFEANGLPPDTPIVSFPNLADRDTPEITETCMRAHHTTRTRSDFMCAFSRMVFKRNDRMQVCACALVDDDPLYDSGNSLAASIGVRTMLKHPRCFSCFAGGVSCSEI